MNPSTPPVAFLAPGHTSKADPSDVRRNNRALIFGLLFPATKLSRAQIGRRTGLSRVAVSDVVGSMLDEGLIREGGLAHNPGKGKRGTLLGIDTQRLHIVSIDLSQSRFIQGAVTDLLGTILYRSELALGAEDTIAIDDIEQLAAQLMDHTDHVIGIGVAAPGVIVDGMVRRSTALGWHDVDLRTPLEQRFAVPVSVDNDSTSGMLAERFFGQGGPNLMFVWFRRGIGTSVLINDVPVVGENHAGGEIGHISIDPEGPPCPCGKRGCLERLISTPVLEARMRDHPESRQTILEQAGVHLANALAMPVGLLDITDICVYGPPDIVNSDFINAAQRYLDQTTASSFHAQTRIRRCEIGSDIAIRGESTAVLRDYLAR